MVGGGQLARMTHQAAIALGQSLAVLAENPDDAAALVCGDVRIGAPDDLDALRAFARRCDVVTFDHEHVPGDLLRRLLDEGITVHPGPDALQYAQDKALMRTRLAGLGLPVPDFELCTSAGLRSTVVAFGERRGYPVVAKTARGGYDGHGVWMIRSAEDVPDIPGDVPMVVEEAVPLRRELAAVVARSPFGQAATWPVVETVQRDGICVQVIAPAPDLPDTRAAAADTLALRIAERLGVVGVMAVELFEVPESAAAPDGLLINELAMRPHNSGHWTIDGAVTSQFEQHLRAVLDYPLGRTDALADHIVMANVLGAADPDGTTIGMDERVHHLAARFPEAKVHLYGKSFRPGRKLGHVTVCGRDLPALRRRATLAADWLGSGTWSDGYRVDAGSDRHVVLRADGWGADRARAAR